MASVRPNATRGSFQSIVAMVFGTAKLTDFKDLSLSLTKQINADLRSANEVPENLGIKKSWSNYLKMIILKM